MLADVSKLPRFSTFLLLPTTDRTIRWSFERQCWWCDDDDDDDDDVLLIRYLLRRIQIMAIRLVGCMVEIAIPVSTEDFVKALQARAVVIFAASHMKSHFRAF